MSVFAVCLDFVIFNEKLTFCSFFFNSVTDFKGTEYLRVLKK